MTTEVGPLMENIIIEEIKMLLEDGGIELTSDTPLIGGDTALDSMQLVSLCLRLEEIAEEQGFEFDWTSETAMSKSRSMFRSIRRLSDEFKLQKSQS